MAISAGSLAALLIITSILALPFPATSSSNKTDYLSLLSLKNAIQDPLGALSSWNETTHFCSWEGIRCSRRHPDRVVAIDLRSQGLVGSLSHSIGNMSFLRTINLQTNRFRGTIPSDIGRLRRLEFIDFSNNSFTGEVPGNLSECSNLVYLNLIDNLLSGSIPPELGFLSKMEQLGLTKNNFSGHIPPSIGNLTSLFMLSIGESNLMGRIPESLGQLRKMKFLILNYNNHTGEIPSALLNISSILVFECRGNQLRGAIPVSIGITLPNLARLNIGDNQFSGPIPASLANASSLYLIDISENYFGGRMPNLGKLSHLQILLIAMNPIQDNISFISPLVNCTNLEVLGIGVSPSISGELPDSIANLSSHLSDLMIQNTQVYGNIPSGIGNLVGLTRISLSHNNLEGVIPPSIGELSGLIELSLGTNRLTGEIPYSLGNMTLLTGLYLIRNQLSGSIPKSLMHCKKLLALYLFSNNLSGPIPPEIFNLSSISISLDLSYNAFTNQLPSEIQSMTQLTNLFLSHNRLSGVIPNSLSSCTSLENVYLGGNLFEGVIPQGLSALKGLQVLDISRNQISGSIPSFLGELQLQNLNLSFNRLTGKVPMLGVFSNHSAISVEGNEGLCGGIQELKLPPCRFPHSSRKNLPTLFKILIPIGVVSFLCFLIFLYRKRKPKKDTPSLPTFMSTEFLRLSYADLLKATNGFSEINLVGAGRFGSVYKGYLNDGEITIAVKVLNLLVQGASKSFMKECDALRHKRHRNLLKILSVCDSADFKGNPFKALVYEFKSNGSLENWLHHSITTNHEEKDEKLGNLDIIQRLNIAIDISRGLEYLHCGTESTIVHGDLKPSNILLAEDMTACVGDFGLSKVISCIIQRNERSSSSIGIKGTIGYVPPEYGTNILISTQGDVYSYGILLLEIFTNRRPTENLFKDQLNLHSFVTAGLKDQVEEICMPLVQMGHDLNVEKAKDLMASVLSIGVACSKENPRDRMSMTEVAYELQKIKDHYIAK